MGVDKGALNELVKPLNDVKPCGDNCRKSDAFIRLKDEVRKLENINSDGKINWSIVAKHASQYLTEQSKDSLVAAYLVVSWTHLYDLQGLAQALTFMTQLVKDFGVQLHPENKPRAQASALTWMAKHLVAYCQQQDITAAKIKPLQKIKHQAQELDALFEKMFEHTVFGKFISNLDAIVEQYEITQAHLLTQKITQQETEQPDPAPEYIELNTEQLAHRTSEHDDEETSLTDELLNLSENLRQQNIFDLQAYIYSRTAIWQDMQFVAERLAEDNLYIPAPQHMYIKQVEALANIQLDDNDFASLEEIAIAHPYWLDVHYLVAQKSMAVSGGNIIANFILAWLNQMLLSFPDFSRLTFDDGTASISTETLNGLHAVQDAVVLSHDDAMLKDINKLANLTTKAAKKSIETIQKEVNGMSSGKARLQASLSLVSVLPDSAISNYLPFYLKQIETDFHLFRLEEWDPELAIKVLTTLYKANKSLGNQANNEQIQFALAKLMILDHTRFTELESYTKAG